MGGPSLAGFRLHMSEAGARRRIGDADEVLATGTLDLASGELGFALQWLVAVGAVEFEFVRVHKFQPLHAQSRGKKYVGKFLHTFSCPAAHVESDEQP